ncbi:MAG: CbiX/SirB N-terminal domain-containing protein [Planctomycetota bacterium]
MTEGLIIVDHGSRRPESNQMLEEVARLFADRHRDTTPVVEPAHMELAMPDIAAAYAKCVERGASLITLVPFFLAKGKHWMKDIPSLTSQAAAKHPGTSYRIAEPLQIDDLILDLLKKRADAAGEQPTFESGQDDPRLAGVTPSDRRVQCATCPFQVTAAGVIELKPGKGVTLEALAARVQKA